MLTLTTKAISKIKDISDAEGIGHFNIRIKIVGGGCSGMQFDMFYENNIMDIDEIIEIDEVKIIIDPLSFQYMDEICCDYIEDTISSGFKFSGGQIKSTCGCGNSVSF